MALYLLEFFADKIPYVEHGLGRRPHFHPPTRRGASCLRSSRWRRPRVALGRRVDRWRSRSYFAWDKASARAAVNASPEPFSNWALSFGEDVLAVWLAWMAAAHPIATTIIVAALLALSAFLLYHLFRFARRAFQQFFSAG